MKTQIKKNMARPLFYTLLLAFFGLIAFTGFAKNKTGTPLTSKTFVLVHGACLRWAISLSFSSNCTIPPPIGNHGIKAIFWIYNILIQAPDYGQVHYSGFEPKQPESVAVRV